MFHRGADTNLRIPPPMFCLSHLTQSVPFPLHVNRLAEHDVSTADGLTFLKAVLQDRVLM